LKKLSVIFLILIATTGQVHAEDHASYLREVIEKLTESRVRVCLGDNGSKLLCPQFERSDADVTIGSRLLDPSLIEQDIDDLSVQILSSPQYEEMLRALDQVYGAANEDQKHTILSLATLLNQNWLKRYQPEVDHWFATAQESLDQNLLVGWLAYVSVFAVTNYVSKVPKALAFLRRSLPWQMVAGVGVASAISTARPVVPPPPYAFLSFGWPDHPGEDVVAQLDHKRHLEMREFMSPQNVFFFSQLTMGPLFGAASSTARFAWLYRALAATRVTPVSLFASAVLSAVVSEAAKWASDQWHRRDLYNQLVAPSADSSNMAYELSLAINGLHISYLGEMDAKVHEMEKQLSVLMKLDRENLIQKREFEKWAVNITAFRGYRQHRIAANAEIFALFMRNQYDRVIQSTDAFVKVLNQAAVATQSDLVKSVIERRLKRLEGSRAEWSKKREEFNVQGLSDQLLKIFPSQRSLSWGNS